MKQLRFLHSWLGVIVLPWIIVIGATGFYLNHSRTILSWIEGASYDESRFADWVDGPPLSRQQADITADAVWPDEAVKAVEPDEYHGMPAYVFKKDSGQIIVTRKTGHYFVKTRYTRKTFDPDGRQLHGKIYWGRIFKELHTDGWLGGALRSWLADITSIAMIVFGLTGLLMWWLPRARRNLRR